MKQSIFSFFSAATAVLTTSVTLTGSVYAQTRSLEPLPAHIPVVQTAHGASLNWSGYAVSTGQVTSVTGTFNVPTVGAPGAIDGLPPDVSAWVGIDGYTSGTVEQIGVSGAWDAKSGQAVYYAWWEMYPRNSQTIKSLNISAGDLMTASVVYLGRGRFSLSITDNSTGQSFTTTASAPVGGANAAQLNSAEWVVERAATIYKGYLTILPLATFNGVTFTDAAFTVANGTPTTLLDVVDHDTKYSGPPATAPSQPYWEQMTIVGLDSSGNDYPLDAVSALAGNSFSASFLENGTPLPIPGVFRQK